MAIRAAVQIRELFQNLADSKASKVEKANDLFAPEIVSLVRAHMLYLSFTIFRNTIETTEFKDNRILPILILLAKIFALKQLTIDSTSCYESGYFGSGSKKLLIEAMKKSLIELRPHMISLVELESDELVD